MTFNSVLKYLKGIRLVLLRIMVIDFMLFTIGLILFSVYSKKERNKIKIDQKANLFNSFNALNNEKSVYYESILTDYACFDWMISFIKEPKKYDPNKTITPTNDLHLSVFQVIGLNKNTLYCSNSGFPDGDTITFKDSFFKKLLKNRSLVFFQRFDTLLIEFHASTIHNSGDIHKTSVPQGYIIIGKVWDQKYINQISTITNTKISLNLLKHPRLNMNSENHLLDLNDYNGRLQSTITYIPNAVLPNSILLPKGFFETYSILLFLSIVLLCHWGFEYRIMKPIKTLQKSLKNLDVTLLGPMVMNENEFSSIAEFVQEYFGQIEWAHYIIDEMQRTKDELLVQKEKIEQQNSELEIQTEKLAVAYRQLEYQNGQITDGIKYASMIQHAVLTSQFNLEKIFKDHFIFYKPKEILSGDFYWFKEFYGKYYFAVADCTGHGLSGAMMSMLGISFLNELTHHHNNKDSSPSIILDKLRLKLVETLHQTGEIGQIRDGMDISLCMYDPENKKLNYAGAYNILYQLVKHSDGSIELHEYKGDRMPVGISDNTESFTNYSITINPDDVFYLITDGYTDQFGGPNRKKLNKQNFKNVLLSIQNLTLLEQRLYIKEFLSNWVGNLEQVDDITVVGIKMF